MPMPATKIPAKMALLKMFHLPLASNTTGAEARGFFLPCPLPARSPRCSSSFSSSKKFESSGRKDSLRLHLAGWKAVFVIVNILLEATTCRASLPGIVIITPTKRLRTIKIRSLQDILSRSGFFLRMPSSQATRLLLLWCSRMAMAKTESGGLAV